MGDPLLIAEFERRVKAAQRSAWVAKPADNRERVARLDREISNLTDAIAKGLLSAALAARLTKAEAELAEVRAAAAVRHARPAVAGPVDVRAGFLALVRKLDQILVRDPEQGREELRKVLEGKVRLRLGTAGRYLWADYALRSEALLPRQTSADIVVAGAGCQRDRRGPVAWRWRREYSVKRSVSMLLTPGALGRGFYLCVGIMGPGRLLRARRRRCKRAALYGRVA
ncbi:MAG: hypothetical protein JSS29_10985 [Proteobacteria bacterium]|nr:hypothetical protein [Pseudomonadota bacterium]